MNNKILNFISLHKDEEDKQKVLDDVKNNISFRNANFWILACAILIASIGLNVNSTAVIIGAMLISPLMGPIVGTGFALGTYDFDLLKRAGKNLIIATIVSLLVATTYFFISPFKETQSELLARTSPTIYDVLIAFFGGVVGVISLTRVNKGNPIPGVAIATALMPPLCTAGYGLAIGNIQYFLGAFYLYSINCFFICIATFLITKFLKYPPVKSINPKYDKQIRRGLTLMIFVMIIPSSYLAYDLYNEKKYSQKVEQFIEHEFTNKGYILIYKKIGYKTYPKKIELAFLVKKFDANEITAVNEKLATYGIYNTDLTIKQDIRDIKDEIMKEISNQDKVFLEKDIQISELKNELLAYKYEDQTLFKEIQILFPELDNISLGKHQKYISPDSTKEMTVLVYQTERKNRKPDLIKLKKWLEQKLNTKDILIVKQE